MRAKPLLKIHAGSAACNSKGWQGLDKDMRVLIPQVPVLVLRSSDTVR